MSRVDSAQLLLVLNAVVRLSLWKGRRGVRWSVGVTNSLF